MHFVGGEKSVDSNFLLCALLSCLSHWQNLWLENPRNASNLVKSLKSKLLLDIWHFYLNQNASFPSSKKEKQLFVSGSDCCIHSIFAAETLNDIFPRKKSWLAPVPIWHQNWMLGYQSLKKKVSFENQRRRERFPGGSNNNQERCQLLLTNQARGSSGQRQFNINNLFN